MEKRRTIAFSLATDFAMEVSDMILEKSKRLQTIGILTIFVSALVLVSAGSVACKKKGEGAEAATAAETSTTLKEGLNEFEGTVKVASARYLYIPEIQGIDILVQGMPDLAGVEGKAVKLQGEFNREKPSLLVATKIDVKDGGNVFTKSADADFSDYVDLKDRSGFAALKIDNVNKTDQWEGKGQGKIFGKLQAQTVTDAGAAKEVYRINFADDKGKPAGIVIIDSVSDYAKYYLKKLRLFDSFWFYFKIKNTVDARTRVKTRELFHADLVCVGLF
jgi:hypothetical protein